MGISSTVSHCSTDDDLALLLWNVEWMTASAALQAIMNASMFDLLMTTVTCKQ